jgi:cytochrome c oxidase assembly protein subunit 15
MTESVLTGQINISSDRPKVQKWMRFLVWKIAIATLLLMAVGSARE